MGTAYVPPGAFVGVVGITASVYGMLAVCRECDARMNGLDGAAVPIYSPGVRVPRGPTGGDIRVCGVCRTAFRENDSLHVIRIREEDLPHGNALTKPGAHMCCPDCLEKWRPIILARLIRNQEVSPDVTEENMPEDMLL